jgi:UPF0042 nucleotide-binding protein
METSLSSNQKLRIVLITGLSGAGKTLALKTLEDLEYFAIDNLPCSLLDPLTLLLEKQQEITRVALVMDGRDRSFLQQAPTILESLRQREHQVTLLFLEASREALIRRFAETRRPHPLARNEPVESGVAREEKALRPLRRLASHVLDTTVFNVHELRRRVISLAEESPGQPLPLFVTSFGFKYGPPLEAAFIFDVRYLPNPFFVEKLRALAGTDAEVADYVFANEEARTMRDKIADMVRTVLPLCRREGRSQLMVAIGCTGGRHRSVALAEAVAEALRGEGLELTVMHRDLARQLPQS